MSAQEAVFRLLGMPMLSCTGKRVFVPTDMAENRIRILKASQELERLHPDSEDVYRTGTVQRYMARPASLHNVCLAEFVADYDVCYGRKETREEHD